MAEWISAGAELRARIPNTPLRRVCFIQFCPGSSTSTTTVAPACCKARLVTAICGSGSARSTRATSARDSAARCASAERWVANPAACRDESSWTTRSNSPLRAAEAAAIHTRVLPPPFLLDMQLPRRPIREGYGDFQRSTGAQNVGLHTVADFGLPQQMLDVRRVFDCAATEVGDEIANQDAGFLRGARRLNVHHQQRRVLLRAELTAQVLGKGYRLHGQTEIWPR